MSYTTRPRFRSVRLIAPLAVAVAAGASALAIAQQQQSGAEAAKLNTAEPAPMTSEVRSAIDHAEGLSTAFAHAAETISPSLVHISVERSFTVSSRMQPQRRRAVPQLPPGFEEFERFFDREPFGRTPRSMPREFSRDGLGSGVIVSEAGHIITNHHVVAVGGPAIAPNVFGSSEERAESARELYDAANENLEINVTLHDGEVRSATLIASDPEVDLAVLQLDDAADVQPARFADSSTLRVGEWVIAAGSPFGLGRSITSGIVSATGRTGVGLSAIESYIQTDAAINPGNSGGPLVNLRGEIVGINTAIASRSGGFNGVGFAIPSNLVQLTYNDLIDDGVTDRPFLGIEGQNLTRELADSFGLRDARGAVVSRVLEGAAAAEAGLQAGDVILAVNGEPIADFQQLRVKLAQFAVGDRVVLNVHRDGERLELAVELGARADAQVAQAPNTAAQTLGITVEANAEGSGVVITEVRRGSPAARLGFEPGWVILSVQNDAVNTLDDWANAVERLEEDRAIRLLVQTPQGNRFFVFQRGWSRR